MTGLPSLLPRRDSMWRRLRCTMRARAYCPFALGTRSSARAPRPHTGTRKRRTSSTTKGQSGVFELRGQAGLLVGRKPGRRVAASTARRGGAAVARAHYIEERPRRHGGGVRGRCRGDCHARSCADTQGSDLVHYLTPNIRIECHSPASSSLAAVPPFVPTSPTNPCVEPIARGTMLIEESSALRGRAQHLTIEEVVDDCTHQA
jgi:hypothetical protein